ncbi:bifunctional 5,10-methylenetetrahydrofolate dehydrogenase/5,10-methenyltetrahydrofolate cyclohydrolase, partial [bacterium]|nr:bifunctional 5,10-methylenetetrahydrofolate dehydrogenase/5,10-methenyltetrahydrofolate cyclohydrolase [bacterium]
MPKTKILSGKEVSESVYNNLLPRIQKLKQKGITPGLAVVLVGDDPASQVYVNSKSRKFNKLELFSETILLPSDTTETELISRIQELNNDNRFHGILVQSPLPKHLDYNKIVLEVKPQKDVDGFHPLNVGKLASGNPQFIPCTPKGVMRIFEHYNIELSGKHVVVLGRSNIVGRPLSILTSLKTNYANATTTICHSGTPDIPKITKQADIIITAIGVPEMIDETYIKPGAVVIDVGINRVEDDSEKGYKLVGDVNFESVNG